MTNWLSINHQYNQDLTQHEVLLCGEIDGRRPYAAFALPKEINNSDFTTFISQLNEGLKHVYSVDATPHN